MYSLEQVFQDSSIRCSLPMLQELYIERCPELTAIFTHATRISLPKLRTLRIRLCDKVKWLFSYSLTIHCPSLEKLKIESCYELERLVQEEVAHGDRLLHQRESHHDLPNYTYETERAFLVVIAKSFKQLQDHEALTLFLRLKLVVIKRSGRRKKGMFEMQVRGTVEGEESSEAQEEPLKLNSELCSLKFTDLAELEYIWKGPTQSLSHHRLATVILWWCPKLRNIFTFAIVTSLPELKTLLVSICMEWEGIFCEESLKNLSSSSSNVCFLKLQKIEIRKCIKVKRLFSYSLASHCPSLEEITIKDCSQLEGVVQAYEGEIAGRLERFFPKLNYLKLKRLPKLRDIYPCYEFNHLSDTIHIEDCPNICNIPLQCKSSSGTWLGNK
ncbi:hypothetical protein K1719_033932 [Acacia pycnantha]|nr:hypothetical protein K1719_033932 [Acacia pycnantha]